MDTLNSPQEHKERMARILIDVGSVGARPEQPFVLTSGTLSPVYIDVRRLISFVDAREEAVSMLEALVKTTVSEEIQGVAGGETAGIPYAAFLGWKMRLPMLYVRKKAKGFGRNAQVEGSVPEGSNVILVEDLMFDSGSKINFINGLRNADLKVSHVFVLASYGFYEQYESHLGEVGAKGHCVTDWPTIIDVGEKIGYFSSQDSKIVREFLNDPHAWSKERGGK